MTKHSGVGPVFHHLPKDEGPNDLFVIRVAGNGLGGEVLGSLKYAVEHLGGSLKLIAVLGHSGCGALTTAVDVFLNPRKLYTKLFINPELYAAEAYMDGKLTLEEGAVIRGCPTSRNCGAGTSGRYRRTA